VHFDGKAVKITRSIQMCAKVTTEVDAFLHGKKNMANVNTLF
jgi:hypothetical protein